MQSLKCFMDVLNRYLHHLGDVIKWQLCSYMYCVYVGDDGTRRQIGGRNIQDVSPKTTKKRLTSNFEFAICITFLLHILYTDVARTIFFLKHPVPALPLSDKVGNPPSDNRTDPPPPLATSRRGDICSFSPPAHACTYSIA